MFELAPEFTSECLGTDAPISCHVQYKASAAVRGGEGNCRLQFSTRIKYGFQGDEVGARCAKRSNVVRPLMNVPGVHLRVLYSAFMVFRTMLFLPCSP